MPKKPQPPASFRFTPEANRIVAQILKDHPYLKNRTGAVLFALYNAPRDEPAPRCPECGNLLVAKRVEDGGTLGVWACYECSDGARPVTVDIDWFKK